MKKGLSILALFFVLILICSGYKRPQQNTADARFNAELFGIYQNVNPKEDYFKRLALGSNGVFQRTDKDPENLEAVNPTKRIIGTWVIDLTAFDLGSLIHFKDPKASGCYGDLVFGYQISHDTLLLANTVLGFADWNRPFILKKIK